MIDVFFYTPTMFSATNDYSRLASNGSVGIPTPRNNVTGRTSPLSTPKTMRHPFNIITEEIYND